MVFFVIVFSIFVAAAEIDIIIPSFPEMQSVFNISPFVVELSLGLNILAHCIAALFVGNLGDKYGKKNIINVGFLIFSIGSLIGALSNNFIFLLIGRVLQGMGVAPAMVLSFLIAIERAKEEDKPKVMGLVHGITTLAISVAPTIGSYVNLYFGWKGNFWTLLALGLIAMILFEIFIPPDKKENTNVSISLMEYVVLLKNKIVILYIIVLCLTIGAYYTFVGISSIFYINGIGVSLKHFGFYQGILTITFGIFSIISGNFIKLFGKKFSFYISIILIIVFLIINSILTYQNVADPAVITLTMLLLSVGFVIPCNVMFTLAIDAVSGASGKISALISTFKWIFTIISLQTVSYFYKQSYTPIGLAVTLMVAVALIFAFIIWIEDKRLKPALM